MEEIVRVPVKQVLLHETVVKAVRNLRPDFSSKGFKRDPTGFMAPLNRMDRIMSANESSLPPITVQLRAIIDGINYYFLLFLLNFLLP